VAVIAAAVAAVGISDAEISHPTWTRPKRPEAPTRVAVDDWPSREELFLPPPPDGGDDSSGSFFDGGRRFGCGHPTHPFRTVVDYYLTELPRMGWDITFAVRMSRATTNRVGGWLLARRDDLRLLLEGSDGPRDPVHWTIEVRPVDGDTAHWEKRAHAVEQIDIERLIDRLSD
jgi:hypothetical protein